MKYFLDFGTHKFEGLAEFTELLGIGTGWHVQCYEPNGAIYKVASEEKLAGLKEKYASLRFENGAIMDYSGFITLNRHDGAGKDSSRQEYIEGYTTGSNTLTENPPVDFGNGVVFKVETDVCKCFDVNEILDEIVRNDSAAEIFIKCDIEGSEFKVLPRLLAVGGALANIRGLWVEWPEAFWFYADPANAQYEQKIRERAALEAAFREKGVTIHFHG